MAPKHRSIQNFNQTYTEQFEPIIMIVPSHEIIDKTVHQLMEILEHVSTPKRGIVVIGPGNIGSVKNISDVPHRGVELVQGHDPVLGTVARKVAQAEKFSPV